MFHSWKDASKETWGRNPTLHDPTPRFTNEEIQIGALQRIATALEAIAKLIDPVERDNRQSRELMRIHMTRVRISLWGVLRDAGVAQKDHHVVWRRVSEWARFTDECPDSLEMTRDLIGKTPANDLSWIVWSELQKLPRVSGPRIKNKLVSAGIWK